MNRRRATVTVRATLALAVLCGVFAGQPSEAAAGEWVSDVSIRKIAVQPQQNIYVLFDKTLPSLGCKGGTSPYGQLNPDLPHFKEQFSLMVAAFMSGKKLDVYVHGCLHYAVVLNTGLKK